ncbi:hypothetical protein AA313_de0203907 [Arthrobotrys entomopaga]|nr:hypothetical protein AA313_de0203907 [Arthrobotrys entomopaga]
MAAISSNTASSSEQPSYLIVGAGTFGASAALHLIKSYPSAKVTIIDQTQFPCAAAAGHDLNKIIRAEYEDAFYMKLAMEAQEMWRQDPIFKPYYHETGIIFAGIEGPGQAVIDNYKKVAGYSPAVLISPQEAKSRFGGIFREADWEGVTHCTWNPAAGWGEAENALNNVIQTAVDLGVEYQIATAAKLLFTSSGRCSGVLSTDGKTLTADRVIVCTGAYTAKLFAESAPESPELQVDGRIVAAAAIMGAFKVPKDQMEKYQTAPIIVQPMNKRPGKKSPRSLSSPISDCEASFRREYPTWCIKPGQVHA